MGKELPSDLRKKIVRLKTAKKKLKVKNGEKTKNNKALRDRTAEIKESRDAWQKKYEEKKKESNLLEENLKIAEAERDQARDRAKLELERAEQLQRELAELRKKKSRG